MDVIILTTQASALASVCLPHLVEAPGIRVKLIVNSQGIPPSRRRFIQRKLQKTLEVGPLGMLNGLRISRWYTRDTARLLGVEPLEQLAARYGIPFEVTATTNSPHTRDLFRRAEADLGLSLGNDYIAKSVFSIPRLGMINIHHELLPAFRGAQSVIWQLYEGSTETGYTIHQIDSHIDTGHLLYRETMPIELKPTLRETVSHNYARLFRASAAGLVYTITHYDELLSAAQPQGEGRSFTTPTFKQFRRMVRQHRRLYRALMEGGGGE
ncbi:MAG: hypothetical protein Kow00124_13490 [Anaerolineae bacterium]